MYCIRRTKRGPVTAHDPEPAAAVHYATAVAGHGPVEGWSAEPGKAVAVTEGVVRRVRAFYEGRPNTGELAFEPVDASVAQLAEAVAAEDAVGVAEFAALQTALAGAQAENAVLRRGLEENDQRLETALRGLREQTTRVRTLEEELVAAGERNAALAVRVTGLEAELALRAEPENKAGRKAK